MRAGYGCLCGFVSLHINVHCTELCTPCMDGYFGSISNYKVINACTMNVHLPRCRCV